MSVVSEPFSVVSARVSNYKKFALDKNSFDQLQVNPAPDGMIVVLGSPGSGKSVQSQRLAESLGYAWVSTGVLLRAQTDETVKRKLNEGSLINDDVVIDVLSRAILSYQIPQQVILDGFPRTIAQADWLVDWAQTHQLPIALIVHLKVSEAIAVARLGQRKREDDTPDAIHSRLEEYNDVVIPIIERFKTSGIRVIELSADSSIDGVHEQIMNTLG